MDKPVLDRQQTIGNLVLDHSECAQVFQRHRIDFCCGGDISIETAAKNKRVDVEVLVEELSAAIAARSGERTDDPRALSTPQLVSHIVEKHHGYLRKTMPFVQMLAAKVSRVHGEHNPKLRDLETAVEDLAASLMPHLDDEERTLFPLVTSSEPDLAVAAVQFSGMAEEHLAVATILERVRAASDEFALPSWACSSYRTLFSELEAMESDVFTHVHLENHVLKPRFATA